MAKEKDPLTDALVATITGGVDAVGVNDLKHRLDAAPAQLADAVARLRSAEDVGTEPCELLHERRVRGLATYRDCEMVAACDPARQVDQ